MRRTSAIVFVVAAVGAATVWFLLSRPDTTRRRQVPVAATNNQNLQASKEAVTRTNPAVGAESLDSLMVRLKAAKAGVERQATQQNAKLQSEAKAAEAAKKVPTPPPEPQMSANDFMAAFADALSKGDSGAIQEVLRKAPRSAECVEALKGLVTAQGSSKDARRYAAEALVRIGTPESVGYVLDQAFAARSAGDSSLASTLLYSLEAPTTVEGAQVLFDLLLSTGRYSTSSDPLPEEFRSSVRKALRNAPDREAIGDLAARLYLDPQISGRSEALLELFNGVSHPSMLAALAVQAYQQGSQENALQFLDRLGQVGDQATVQAMVQAASREPALLNAASERLYAWSLQHPEQAKPGLFMEWITDSSRPPAQRIAAAYGLAGVQDTTEAAKTIEKALAEERDASVRASLAALQGYLREGQPQK